MLVSTSPATGNEGDTLTVVGHAFSAVASENFVMVGGKPCIVTSASNDGSFSPASCPVTSCTLEMQTRMILKCRLPHNDAFQPHVVATGVIGRGRSPLLSTAGVVQYARQLRAFEPSRGSLAGGTTVTLYGDGLSERLGDISVNIGGIRCSVFAANDSHVSCVTGATTSTTSTSSTISMSIRGVTATCVPGSCQYTYDDSLTPKLSSATVVTRTTTKWTIRVQGSGFVTPSSANIILLGGITPCIPYGHEGDTSSQVTCQCDPPLAGDQIVTLANEMGLAKGVPALPLIRGVELSVGSFTPLNVSLAGGAELTISGAGFSAQDSRVSVCEQDCSVTDVTSVNLKCRVPSLLLHASGKHHLNLTNATETQYDLGFAPPPPPPPGVPAVLVADDTLTLRQGKVVAMKFTAGLNDSSLPRGSELSHVGLHVVPHSGGSGAVVAEVRASLYCGDGPLPLSDTELQNYNQTNSSVEWDIQPYDMGFTSDVSPDLTVLIREALASRESLAGCSIVLLLTCKPISTGFRSFYSSTAITKQAELRIIYTPPSSFAQIPWTPDKSCAVTVNIPNSGANITQCSHPVNVASGKSLYDTNSCPHLRLEVSAATSGTNAAPGGAVTSGLHGHAAGTTGYSGCVLTANGLDLLEGCGLNKIVVGRDGVCAALIDPPNAPRAACFDTKAQGEGAEKLAAWIDTLPMGASVMVASCSRLSWAHNRDNLANSLRSLGAQDPPTRIDDAYALIGVKGATAPLSEARTPCCTADICHSCDQTVAHAKADIACGAKITASAPSALGGDNQYLGAWASEAYQAALIAIGDGTAGISGAARQAIAATSFAGVIASLQAEDEEEHDVVCNTALADGMLVRHGAQLATDGDSSSYWLSAGRSDAVLTLDLGVTKLVQALKFDWKHPAASLLLLYSSASHGNDWKFGASVFKSNSAPASLTVSAPGVIARRLRLYMADPSNATWPTFAINELEVSACERPEVGAIASGSMWYSRHSTPRVVSVSPRRGSSAGGTRLTIQVESLPNIAQLTDIEVSIAGTACSVSELRAASGEVVCITGSYGRTSRQAPGLGHIQMTIKGFGTAAAKNEATYEYLDLWSRRTTWGGGSSTIPGLETSGDSVWIQQGQRIMLDCNVKLYMLIVQGTLEFDRTDIEMDANYIFVMGGSFIVGTETDPFMQKALITLHGSPVSQEIPVYGAKTLSCRFCTLDLHGKPLLDGRTHTKLERTARRGDYEIWLREPVDWDVDTQIALTSTHYNGTFEAFDTATVVEVSNGGYRLKLASPLLFEHLGETKYLAGGHKVEFRSDVAILSRNVVIQGDPTFSRLDQHGAHIMLHSRDKKHLSIVDRSQGESLTARIENIEVRYAGQMGRLGRYSIHFHMIGAVRNSYVRKNSIHHTFNRAIAIHGVHYLRVQDNGNLHLVAS